MRPNFVSYIRVSTSQQGKTGLGIAAQQQSVESYVKQRNGVLLGEFIEVESGKKNLKDRPQLKNALAMGRKNSCQLVVGKLDRLSRDVRFFLEVIDTAKVNIVFAELPEIDAHTPEGRMILVSMANFAEFEARKISERTKAALKEAKNKGKLLGVKGFENLKNSVIIRRAAYEDFVLMIEPVYKGIQMQGCSQREIAKKLNQLGVRAFRGGIWSLYQIQRLGKKIKEMEEINEARLFSSQRSLISNRGK